ncbi:hypothetical protein ACOME3_008468 [Neoechinorhynchus agilis]
MRRGNRDWHTNRQMRFSGTIGNPHGNQFRSVCPYQNFNYGYAINPRLTRPPYLPRREPVLLLRRRDLQPYIVMNRPTRDQQRLTTFQSQFMTVPPGFAPLLPRLPYQTPPAWNTQDRQMQQLGEQFASSLNLLPHSPRTIRRRPRLNQMVESDQSKKRRCPDRPAQFALECDYILARKRDEPIKKEQRQRRLSPISNSFKVGVLKNSSYCPSKHFVQLDNCWIRLGGVKEFLSETTFLKLTEDSYNDYLFKSSQCSIFSAVSPDCGRAFMVSNLLKNCRALEKREKDKKSLIGISNLDQDLKSFLRRTKSFPRLAQIVVTAHSLNDWSRLLDQTQNFSIESETLCGIERKLAFVFKSIPLMTSHKSFLTYDFDIGSIVSPVGFSDLKPKSEILLGDGWTKDFSVQCVSKVERDYVKLENVLSIINSAISQIRSEKVTDRCDLFESLITGTDVQEGIVESPSEESSRILLTMAEPAELAFDDLLESTSFAEDTFRPTSTKVLTPTDCATTVDEIVKQGLNRYNFGPDKFLAQEGDRWINCPGLYTKVPKFDFMRMNPEPE